jgi:pSer/pThr/pTyr-binding forkhead associated (FHA) protein
MRQIPSITVRLIHIDGPLKGQEQDFSEPDIAIGRHPSCHIRFPKEAVVISRVHAHIVRDGNSFKIVDQSTNGTFVNGKRVNSEARIKNGDVLMFSGGGPKVAFLTSSMTQPVEPVSSVPIEKHPAEIPAAPEQPVGPGVGTPPAPPLEQYAEQKTPEPRMTAPAPEPKVGFPPESGHFRVEQAAIPLNIQYGPFIKSFKELPVIIGSGGACHFKIDHPGICERHLQVFFHEGSYCVEDLTGKKLVAINGSPVGFYGKLTPDCHLSLSSSGPVFRFIASGSLAEIERPQADQDIESSSSEDQRTGERKKNEQPKSGKHSLFKKFFG